MPHVELWLRFSGLGVCASQHSSLEHVVVKARIWLSSEKGGFQRWSLYTQRWITQPRRDEGTWGGMSRKMSVTLSTLPWILPAVRRPSHSTKGVWAEGTVMVWKKNVPHRLLHLNMWSPVGSTGSRLWASPHSFFSLLPVCRAWIWVRHLTVSFLFPGLYNKAPKLVSGTTHRETHSEHSWKCYFPDLFLLF